MIHRMREIGISTWIQSSSYCYSPEDLHAASARADTEDCKQEVQLLLVGIYTSFIHSYQKLQCLLLG
jgi:hypothetical protein